MKVRHDLLAANVDLTETEHALLLLACQGSASREQAYRVLNCLSREHTTLSEETVQAAEQLFRSREPQLHAKLPTSIAFLRN